MWPVCLGPLIWIPRLSGEAKFPLPCEMQDAHEHVWELKNQRGNDCESAWQCGSYNGDGQPTKCFDRNATFR